MAGKSDTFEADVLKLIFNATAIANIADNAASSPLTNLYVSLHTADPTDTGTQTSSEATYTGYARVAVVRAVGSSTAGPGSTPNGWTVSTTGGVTTAKPFAPITFGACTSDVGGTPSVTHFAIGTASTGAGKVLYAGTCTPNITITNGITPQLTTATSITED